MRLLFFRRDAFRGPHFLPRPPRRRASKALHLARRSATAAPARPQRPCHSLGSARCSLVCFRARRVHASEGERGLAPQQCSRSCTASANQLQLQCTAKTPHSPVPPRPVCDARSHGPFCRAALGRRCVHPQRAAPCSAHRSHCPASRTSRSFLLRSPHARPPARHLVGTAARQTRRFPEL